MATKETIRSVSKKQIPRARQQFKPKSCQYCSETFTPTQPGGRYCTPQCREFARSCTSCCHWCGQAFYHCIDASRLYCSHSCHLKSRALVDEDFWELVDMSPHPQGCWLFTGPLTNKEHNYGTFKGEGAHRYAYRLYHPKQTLTADDYICHTCDNPPCVRNEHLFKATMLENFVDMRQKDRHAKGEQLPQTKLTALLVQEIRRHYATRGGTYKELAEIYGGCLENIGCIVRYKTWKHVQEDTR